MYFLVFSNVRSKIDCELSTAPIEGPETDKKTSRALHLFFGSYLSIPPQLVEAAVTSMLIIFQEAAQKYLGRSVTPQLGIFQ
jgi:hypothetical protein